MLLPKLTSTIPAGQAYQPLPVGSLSSYTASAPSISAFSKALDDIGSTLDSDLTRAGSGTMMSADALNSRIQSLISNELDSGNLTSDQADSLNKLLSFDGVDLELIYANDEGDDPGVDESDASYLSLADFLKQTLIPSAAQPYGTDGQSASSVSRPLLLDLRS